MSEEAAPTFGSLLKQYRTDRGWTQAELAEAAGISRDGISDLERRTRRRPRRETLELLASALSLGFEERGAFIACGRGHRAGSESHSADPGPPPETGMLSLGQIPLPPTPLVGRAEEVAHGLRVLARPEVRLLTLVGSPGVGKTRLALAVAHYPQLPFAEGKAFVSLVSTPDAGHVLPAIMRAVLRYPNADQVTIETVIEALRDRRLLLVLDNFEHVIAAAPLVAELLAVCPGLKVLVTSRVGLQIRGEHQLQVPPLALPNATESISLDILARVPAVTLFIERAKAILPSFTLTQANAPAIIAICQQLDGLPLAIELAAGRLQVYSPQALQKQLHYRLAVLSGGSVDLPLHQRSLRCAVAWSYDLLPPAAQALFRCVAAFSGGASLEAIEVVSHSTSVLEAGADDLPNTLALLINASLLLRYEGVKAELRVGMLETIREYGWEQLHSASEIQPVERAHVEYFLALAEAADSGLQGPEQAGWLDRLEQEHANLRTALQWALTNEEAETALRIAAALWRFWEPRGYVREGLNWLEAALTLAARVPGECSPAALANAHSSTGILTWRVGEYARAQQHQSAALQLHQQLGNPQKVAGDLNNLSAIAYDLGDYVRAEELIVECLAIQRQVGDKRRIALVLKNLGAVAFDQGEFARAQGYIEESLQIRQQLGDQRGIASSLTALGGVAREQGNYAQARECLGNALRLYRHVRDRLGGAIVVHGLATIAYEVGDFQHALRRCRFSLSTLQELGERFHLVQVKQTLGKIAYATGDYTSARVHLEESIALRHDLSERLRIAESLSWLARVTHAQGDNGQALLYLRDSLASYQSYNTKYCLAACLEVLGLVLYGLELHGEAQATLRLATALRTATNTPLPPTEHTLLAQELAPYAEWLTGQSGTASISSTIDTPLEQILTQAQDFIARVRARVSVADGADALVDATRAGRV